MAASPAPAPWQAQGTAAPAAVAPTTFDPSSLWSMLGSGTSSVIGSSGAPGTIGGSVGSGGSAGGNILQGFSFTPPPLILNGQPVAGGLNFLAAAPVAQVDQASQAYSFFQNVLNTAYGFMSGITTQSEALTGALNYDIVGIEKGLGAGELTALQTEAGAMQTAASKIKSGGGGLFSGLFG